MILKFGKLIIDIYVGKHFIIKTVAEFYTGNQLAIFSAHPEQFTQIPSKFLE